MHGYAARVCSLSIYVCARLVRPENEHVEKNTAA